MSAARRQSLLERLVDLICEQPVDGPALVAVNGPDASGKTTFADDLGRAVARNRGVVRVEADSFLNPRAVRYRRGVASAEGYLEDTYDFAALERNVLIPASSGDRRIVRRAFDRASDTAVQAAVELVPNAAVVIIDGSFLLSRRLRAFWTVSILLEVTEQERLNRALARDTSRLGGPNTILKRYRDRYIPGFALYLRTERPEQVATVVIDNTLPAGPVVVAAQKRFESRFSSFS